MLIQAEYCKRHNLNVPVVIHAGTVSVIVEKAGNWSIFSGEWREEDNHPGKYYFAIRKPIPDYYSGEFFHIVEFDPIFWDEYEQFVLDWARTLPKSTRALTEPIEIILSLWNMMMFTHKHLISLEVGDEFHQLEALIHNQQLTSSDRYATYQQALGLLPGYYQDVYNYNYLNYSWNYSYWLTNLIHATTC